MVNLNVKWESLQIYPLPVFFFLSLPGQSFDVYVNGYDVYYKAGQALKGSPENEYVFRTSYVDAYIIPFTQGVGVETLQFQIKLSSSVSQLFLYSACFSYSNILTFSFYLFYIFYSNFK